jgi:hypothetical protein
MGVEPTLVAWEARSLDRSIACLGHIAKIANVLVARAVLPRCWSKRNGQFTPAPVLPSVADQRVHRAGHQRANAAGLHANLAAWLDLTLEIHDPTGSL